MDVLKLIKSSPNTLNAEKISVSVSFCCTNESICCCVGVESYPIVICNCSNGIKVTNLPETCLNGSRICFAIFFLAEFVGSNSIDGKAYLFVVTLSNICFVLCVSIEEYGIICPSTKRYFMLLIVPLFALSLYST